MPRLFFTTRISGPVATCVTGVSCVRLKSQVRMQRLGDERAGRNEKEGIAISRRAREFSQSRDEIPPTSFSTKTVVRRFSLIFGAIVHQARHDVVVAPPAASPDQEASGFAGSLRVGRSVLAADKIAHAMRSQRRPTSHASSSIRFRQFSVLRPTASPRRAPRVNGRARARWPSVRATALPIAAVVGSSEASPKPSAG